MLRKRESVPQDVCKVKRIRNDVQSCRSKEVGIWCPKSQSGKPKAIINILSCHFTTPDKFILCILNNRTLLGKQTFDLKINFAKFTYPGQLPYTFSLLHLAAREDEGTKHLHYIWASSNDFLFNLNLACGHDARLFGRIHPIGCHWLCDHGHETNNIQSVGRS